MICPRCSRQLPDGSKFCDGCGLALTNQAPAQAPAFQQPSQFQGVPQQYPYPQSPLINPGKNFGVASLVLGILSLVLCCIPGLNPIIQITGVALGIIGIVQSKKVNMNNGMAIAGIVCSAIAILITILIFIIFGAIIIEEVEEIDDFDDLFRVLPYVTEELMEEIF